MAPESANGRGKTAVLLIAPETGRLPEEMCTLAGYISGKSGGLGDVVSALCVGLTERGIECHLATINLKKRFQKEVFMFQPRKILVPTDFSEDSDLAFRMALSIAVNYQARIFLLHVISKQDLADYCLDQNIVDRVLNESIVFSNEKLQEVIGKNQQSGNIKVIPDVRKGQPYEEILKEASERKIDLIVIASHGKTGLQKYFIGSVTEKVMKEAKCPVLLIPSQEK